MPKPFISSGLAVSGKHHHLAPNFNLKEEISSICWQGVDAGLLGQHNGTAESHSFSCARGPEYPILKDVEDSSMELAKTALLLENTRKDNCKFVNEKKERRREGSNDGRIVNLALE